MRRMIWCVCLGFFIATSAKALPKQFGYRISFKDKVGSGNINQPLTFLSQKSLDRRTKYSIALDTTDLPVSPAYLDSVRLATNGIIHTTSRWLNNCVVLVQDSSSMQLLRTKPYIKSVEWVGFFSSGLHDKPLRSEEDKFKDELLPANNKLVNKTTGNPAYYGGTWNQTTIVNGDCLHDKGWRGEGITIAVLDNGFNFVDSGPGFDSLMKSGRIVDKYNIARDTSFVFGTAGHGTEVLSVLAGYIPNYYVGAAPLANYALYITEDAGFEQPVELDNLVAGIERADSIGADIVSVSLGYNTFDLPFPTIPTSQLDGKTIVASVASNMAVDKGILMVLSAGNEGSNGLLSPGDANNAMTIGNVNVNKTPAGSSGYGPNASGVIKPDVCGMGDPAAVMRWDMTISQVSGTSTATPGIAGFAACLLQGNPNKTPFEIRDAIRRTGHTFNNPTAQLGYGVPDFCIANVALDVEEVTPNPFLYTLSPNPFSDKIHIHIFSTRNENINIGLYDITGKLLLQHQKSAQQGANNFDLQIPMDISSGIYFLKLQSPSTIHTLKLIKQ